MRPRYLSLSALSFALSRAKAVRLLAGLMIAIAGWACSDSSAPDPAAQSRAESQLNLLSLADSAPALFTDSVTFWAKYNKDTEGEIFFADSLGQPEERYLRFEVEKYSLFKRPDGSQFAQNDSILITIRVVDPANFLFEFQPSGIQFHPNRPADLSISYGHAGGTLPGDYDADGDIDANDREIEVSVSLWRQANPGDPFVSFSSQFEIDLDEIDTEIFEFSRYAVAY